ncbi:MAG: bifunctional metallophosphatase/5'-nucleotidase [Verrucomicrobiota bacterium]
MKPIEIGSNTKQTMRFIHKALIQLFMGSVWLCQSHIASGYTLSIIHMADQEAAMDALFDAPNASSVMNALKDDFENTIIVSSGDNYITGPFFKASAESKMSEFVGPSNTSGMADILINNYLGIQASAVGNHEFDDGPELFNALLTPAGKYVGAAFPYLSANLDFLDSVLADKVEKDGQFHSSLSNKIAKSCVINVNGKLIGIVGATTPTLPEISTIGAIRVDPQQNRDHRALAEIIQASVDELSEQGIQIIILLSHMQDLSIEEELAGYLRDVDVIVGGGSDSILLDEDDRPRDGDDELVYGKYPLWKTSATGERIAVLNTDGQYRYVGRFVAHFDERGVLLPKYDSKMSGAFATDSDGVVALGSVSPDPRIVNLTNALKSLILEKDQNILGMIPEYLEGRKSKIRTQSTNLGQLIAVANLWYARAFSGESVDLSITNAGGIRASIGIETVLPGQTEVSLLPTMATSYKPSGGISQLDIEAAQAFNNELVLVTMTGKQIKETLEEGIKMLPRAHGGFPQVAGIQWAVDPTMQPRTVNTETGNVEHVGGRIRALEINGDIIVENGVLSSLADQVYRVVTSKYLSNGGNGYPIEGYIESDPDRTEYRVLQALIATPGDSTFALSGTEQDALAEYLWIHHQIE